MDQNNDTILVDELVEKIVETSRLSPRYLQAQVEALRDRSTTLEQIPINELRAMALALLDTLFTKPDENH